LLRIRLARTGAKKKASYRVVVIEREKARDGRFVEILGHYNPRRNPAEVVLNRDRINYWLGRGAQPSETVRSLVKKTAAPKA
jgi:small subunit ribosomal protein S16